MCDARVKELHRNYCRRPHPLRVVPIRSLMHYSHLRCLDCAYPRPASNEKWRQEVQRSAELTNWNSASKLSCVATAFEWHFLELKSLPPSFSLDTSRNSAFPMEKNGNNLDEYFDLIYYLTLSCSWVFRDPIYSCAFLKSFSIYARS